MEDFDNIPLPEILNTLSDGVILFQNGHAVTANLRAAELLGYDITGAPLLKLLGDADIDLLHGDTEQTLVYHLSINRRWLTLTARQTGKDITVVSLREDSASNAALPFPQDEEDLIWLRTVAARLALFSDAWDKLPTDELSAELRKYADQLQKYAGNSALRAVSDAAEKTVDPVGFSFAALIEHATELIGDKLSRIGVTVSYAPKEELRSAVIFGNPQFFLKLLLNTVDALIYHCKESADKRPVCISLGEGTFANYLYLRFSYTAPNAFPSDRETLEANLHRSPWHFTSAYAASVKLVFSVVRLYNGMLVSKAGGDTHELRLYFPQSPAALSAPVDLSVYQVYPEVELSDTLSNPRFQRTE